MDFWNREMEEELALSTPRIDLVLQYLQDRCTPFPLVKNRLCSSRPTAASSDLPAAAASPPCAQPACLLLPDLSGSYDLCSLCIFVVSVTRWMSFIYLFN